MQRFLAMLAAVSLSTSAIGDQPPKPAAEPKAGGKAPLILSFTDLKWTKRPELKGSQFAVVCPR